ncbi:MAG: response regulator [Desulfobacterales bacterium]|jgi:PAS domain S-box-containing protein|nr:response regulator [Desulfobacterales bacterium]
MSNLGHNLFRTIFEIAPFGIVIADGEGRPLKANPAFMAMFGTSAEELARGKSGGTTPSEPLQRLMSQCRARITATAAETAAQRVTLQRTDGSAFFGHVITAAIDIDGHPGVIGFIQDVTGQVLMEKEREQISAQAQQAQKMEAIGTLAGGIAHDFNNLLMGIQGNISLIMLNKETGHRDVPHLKNIEKAVVRGSELTRQILGFARGGKYEVRATDCNHLLERVVALFSRTRKELTIRKNFQEPLWSVDADQGQLEQVLLNLFVNAWEAMPGGGEIQLETANLSVEENTPGRPPDAALGRYVCLTVTDTGIGMDAQTQARIFEPFFTTKKTGSATGLGLSSVFGIVQNHHGFVTVRSGKGRGTTFRVFLPAAAPAPARAAAAPAAPNGRERPATLLLVEDEEMVAAIADQMLTRLGHKVFLAGSGAEAVAIYKEQRDKIDLVILDMIMPGMSGAEAFEQLKTIDPQVKVLLSSGYSLNGQAAAILNRGCRGFIQKPFTIDQLSQKIREILFAPESAPV